MIYDLSYITCPPRTTLPLAPPPQMVASDTKHHGDRRWVLYPVGVQWDCFETFQRAKCATFKSYNV